jgi:hypothetical protein
MNKYNVKALRKELDDCIRSRAWSRLRSRLRSIVAPANSDLCQAVVLAKSKLGGTLLHTLVTHRHESVLPLAVTVATAVPQALAVQDSLLRTPLHILIEVTQPRELLKAFLTILRDEEQNARERTNTRELTDHRVRELSLLAVLSTRDNAGDSPLLKAARGYETQYVALLLQHDHTQGTLLVPTKKRRNSPVGNDRTALYYMASGELHSAYKHAQYDIPPELRLVLIGTYFALLRQQQVEIPDHEWVFFWQELDLLSTVKEDGSEGTGDENRAVPLTVRALVICSHLLGKYAVKLLDFLLENDTYREYILSREVDQQGNYLVHYVANGSSDRVTTALLWDQLKQWPREFSIATRHANRDGNMPVHLAILAGQWDLVHSLILDCPEALLHANCRKELPLHIMMKSSTIHPHNTQQIFDAFPGIWKAQPSVIEIRDGPTQLYPFQLAASRDWGLWLASTVYDATTCDRLSQDSNKEIDAIWVNIVFDLLSAAPQVI